MAERFWIIETQISQNKNSYGLIGYADIDDDEKNIAIHFEINNYNSQNSDRPFVFIDANYSVDNPIIESGIIIGAATTYGLCVSSAGFKFLRKEVRACYAASKKQNPSADRGERLRDIAECLRQKGSEAKDAFTDALTDCLPLKDFFNGSDEPED